MIHRTLIAVTAVIGLTVAGAGVANAEVLGQFVFQGTQTGIDATATEFTFDTYTFDVTNNTSRSIDTFGIDATDNISFTGNFLQAGGATDRPVPALLPDPLAGLFGLPGDALQDDTFFIADDEGGAGTKVVLGIIDSATELTASAVASTGNIIAPGETRSIAFFSVEPGTVPTGGFGAPAIGLVNGQRQILARIEEIPEPSSLALLGLGGFALIRRRRAAHQA